MESYKKKIIFSLKYSLKLCFWFWAKKKVMFVKLKNKVVMTSLPDIYFVLIRIHINCVIQKTCNCLVESCRPSNEIV